MKVFLKYHDDIVPEGIYCIQEIWYCCDKMKREIKAKKIYYEKINYCPYCGEKILIEKED